MVDRTTILMGMEVYGSDEAFIGVVEQVTDDGFKMHDEEITFGSVARVEGSNLYLRDEGTHYHPQARTDDSADEGERADR